MSVDHQSQADAAHALPREQARERVARLGSNAVGVEDLLAVLLSDRRGEAVEVIASDLLVRLDGLIGIASLDVSGLRRHGLSAASAARVHVAIELGRRLVQARRRDRPKLNTPEAVSAAIGPSMAGLPHEQLFCIPLDAQSRLIGEPRVVSIGDVDGTEAGPRAFFRIALMAGASSAIAVHNHPTGDPSPSAADRVVTQKFAAAGRLVDVPLVDHVVVSDGGVFASIRRLHPDAFH